MNTRIASGVFICGLCMLPVAHALEANQQPNPTTATDGLPDQSAHEHGVAKLMMSTSGDGIEIMLETPAVNIFGIEQKPTTEEGRKQLEENRRKLEAGDSLFEMNPEAGCSQLSAEVSSSLLDSNGATDAEKVDNAGHSDVDASWSFSCAQPDALKKVSIHLFSHFPNGFQKIKAEWVTENQESALDMEGDGVILFAE